MEPLLGEFNIGVRTESQILEKVLKFDQQFSRPGKCRENDTSLVFIPKPQQVLQKLNVFCFGQI